VTLVAQAMAGLGCQPIFGRPFSITSSLVVRSRIGEPSSTRHMRQLPATGSLGW